MFRNMVACLCIALVPLSSTAFGALVEQRITPKYIAMYEERFEVKTVVRERIVEFRFTRFVHNQSIRVGEIVIRKGGRTLVACELFPSEDKTRVGYMFTVSRDYISESQFILSEHEFLVVPGHVPDRALPAPGGWVYQFHLRDFVSIADDLP